jgi:hypothetical protein
MEKTRSKLSEMEKGIRDILNGERSVWVPDEDIDMSVFAEYPKQREGIAVYYPILRDGSCASPIYIRFFRSPNGMSIEIADEHEYRIQEKERLGYLLRR